MRDKMWIKYANKNEQKSGTLVKFWDMTQRILQQHVMMHEHMTRLTTMHMFTQLRQSTPTLFITCLHQQFNINSM